MSLFNLFLTFSLAVGVLGDGEVIFMSKPPSIEFRGHEECDSGVVKNICLASLGFTTYQTGDWSGMYITDPFHFAQCVMVVTVPGVSSSGITDGHKFRLISDAPMDEIFTTIETSILERYPFVENQTLVEINLEDDLKAAETTLNTGSLHITRPNVSYLKEEEVEDGAFISQIALLNAISDKIKEKGVSEDGVPDLYSMNLNGLHPVVDIYGGSSNTATEAEQLLMSTIRYMKEVLDEAYQNKTLFLVVTSDTAHTRRYRRATSSELATDRNLAPVYDENYPVFFNIFFWFTIAFIMSIIATSMVTACMDPGRDSIIYRMTSTRMKKDN